MRRQAQELLFEKIIVDQSEEHLKELRQQNKVIADIVWRCNFCKSVYVSEQSVKKHVKHCPKRNFSQVRCFSTLEYRRSLKIHGITSIEQAYKIIVSLSHPSKMPCLGYSISAKRCISGAILAKIEGTICNGCYALNQQSWYTKSHVAPILEKRADAINHPDWKWAMIYAIDYYHCNLFRWHDSGDLQSITHLEMIAFIAQSSTFCKFWLPTREYGMVRKLWERNGEKPLKEVFPNLKIILSAREFDKEAPYELAKKWGVSVSESHITDYTCPAPDQGNKCGDCRKCWNQKVFKVVYMKH